MIGGASKIYQGSVLAYIQTRQLIVGAIQSRQGGAAAYV